MKEKKCNHYSGVDDGFYCWKCLEREKHKQAKEIFEYIEENYSLGYKLDKWKKLKNSYL